jgi:hypothetical protein
VESTDSYCVVARGKRQYVQDVTVSDQVLFQIFEEEDSLGSLEFLKNSLSLLPMFFFFLSFVASRCSDCGRCSMESLLRSL